jgi:hypothetical protein
VIHGVGTPALVKGAGFGEEGKRTAMLYAGYDGCYEIRRNVGIVVAFSHVELDRHLVLRLDDFFEPGSLDQFFGGGQPLALTAVVGKLDEKNLGTVDGCTSWSVPSE